jgi:hypothetical protein
MPSMTPLDSLLMTIVLATLAIGLPVVFVLAVRFLWDRTLSLSRSKELEKLIWQLHRIASAMEHQMNVSFPAVQPGTEEPRDIVYLQRSAAPATAARAAAAAGVAASATPGLAGQPIGAPEQAAQQFPPVAPGVAPAQSSGDATRHGVNSMFGL